MGESVTKGQTERLQELQEQVEKLCVLREDMVFTGNHMLTLFRQLLDILVQEGEVCDE